MPRPVDESGAAAVEEEEQEDGIDWGAVDFGAIDAAAAKPVDGESAVAAVAQVGAGDIESDLFCDEQFDDDNGIDWDSVGAAELAAMDRVLPSPPPPAAQRPVFEMRRVG